MAATITFYRQGRHDGGVRTGIEVDGDPVLGLFNAGKSEDDPALDWYVDVRCEGNSLPSDPFAARKWLLDNGPGITAGIRRLIERIQTGVDVESWPVEHRVTGGPRGTSIKIVSSATRRVAGIELPNVLREIADKWGAILKGLREMVSVSHAD